jgi:hypothetical protein
MLLSSISGSSVLVVEITSLSGVSLCCVLGCLSAAGNTFVLLRVHFVMQRKRIFKVAVRVLAVAGCLLACLIVATILERRRTQAELGAVVSAYLTDEILHDAHDWGSGRGILVVLQREAQVPADSRWRWLWLFHWRIEFPEASLATRASFILSNSMPSTIHAALHRPHGVDSVVASRRELEQAEDTGFAQRFPQSLGYIAVSQAGFNAGKTEVIFYIDHFCGLCGGGNYILMRKVNGAWIVVGQRGTWVS